MSGPPDHTNSNTLPILTRHPLRQRNSSTSEDYEDTEAGTDDDGGILTPTTTQAHEMGLDDMPPTYEQAQALSARDLPAPRRPPESLAWAGPEKPFDGPTSPPAASSWVAAQTHVSAIGGETPMLQQPLTFAPARILETVCVAIPPVTRPEQHLQFISAYSLRLSNLGMPSATFCDFVDGLNAVLRHSPSKTASRQALISLADPAEEETTSTAAQLGEYLRQANDQLFAPKGLVVALQTAVDLLDSITPRDGTYKQVRAKLRRTLWDAKTEREAVSSLVPNVESLTWSAPIRTAQRHSQVVANQPLSDAKAELRAAQCPWEQQDIPTASHDLQASTLPDWYAPSEASSSDVYTPRTSYQDGHGSDQISRSAHALALMLDDSGTDSDASTHSNTESRIHASNGLAEAHRHHASVVAGIERTARHKVFGLGDHPRHADMLKYEGKRCAKLNHAAAVRHTAEVHYSSATLQRRQRRAAKWLERELKAPGANVAEVHRGRAARVAREAARHAERVKRASEQLACCHEDRARDHHETAIWHAARKRKLAWEVWLVVRNVQV